MTLPVDNLSLTVTGNATDDRERVLPAGTPATLPGYEVHGELGRGGMGVVYRARQIKANRIVALKMILAGGHAGEAELTRFRTEAEALARLQHPNIVQVHEVGEHEGLPFFSLEFCGGGSLDRMLAGTPLPSMETARLVETLARAMHAAHQAGVIHRDLKPANVLLASGGREPPVPASTGNSRPSLAELTPKITDFGLAKKLDDGAGQTQSGAVVGTPSYMAPEQARGKSKELSPAVDIYALGAILYECLTGRPPFRAATPLDTILQVMADEPVPPSVLQSKTPRDLETICLKCLHKDPGKRYSSALALADDLGRYQRGEPITARPVGRLERGWRWCRRNPAGAALLAASVVALLAVVVVVVGLVYQGQLEDRNAQLDSSNTRLESTNQELTESLGRETELLTRQKELTDELRKARDAQEQTLYYRRVSLALAEWRINELPSARKLLGECPVERRQWEWHYVNGLFHSERLSLNTSKPGVLTFSPDGTRLAVATGEKVPDMVKVFDLATGKLTSTLAGHSQGIICLAFSPDGTRIVMGCPNGTATVSELTSGKKVFTLNGHNRTVHSVAFSQDGKRIATGDDESVKLWDAVSGMPVQAVDSSGGSPRPLRLDNTGGSVSALAFSPDGRQLAGASASWLLVWDLTTPQRPPLRAGSGTVTRALAFSPDGRLIASPGTANDVKVYDLGNVRDRNRTLTHVLTLKGHTLQVTRVRFSPDRRRLGTTSLDKTAKVWDLTTGQDIFTVRGLAQFSTDFSPDLWRVASAHEDNTVKVWNAASEPGTVLTQVAGEVHDLAFSSDGKRLSAAVSRYGVPRQGPIAVSWDVSSGRADLLRARDGAPDPDADEPDETRAAAFSPDGKRLALVRADGQGRLWEVQLWDTATGTKGLTLKGGHTKRIAAIAFSPDGQRLATASTDQTVKVWDTATGRDLLTLKGHTNTVRSVTFSPDGLTLASGTGGWEHGKTSPEEVRLWDAQTGQHRATLSGHTGPVTSVAFSRDGKWLASGSWDRTVKLWDLAGKQEPRTLIGHLAGIAVVAFSPDGKRLASGSDSLKLWDTTTGQEALSIKAHNAGTSHLAFSPDGKRLAAGHDTVKVFDATETTAKGQ